MKYLRKIGSQICPSVRRGALLGLTLLALLSSCEKFAGEKTELDFIEPPELRGNREIAYVPVLPVLDDFIRPVDITIGFDDLIYVVDEGTQEVVVLDESGRILGRKFVQGAKAVTHDRRFDLLVVGTIDTNLVQGADTVTRTLSCIYRLNQFAGDNYNLSTARISNKIVHPFYFKSNATDFDEINNVSFQKIDIIGDNSSAQENNAFYATRSGTNTTGVLGPDDAVILFNNRDEFVTPIRVNTSVSGVRDDYFQNPIGISTFTKPPQINAVGSRSFLFTSLDKGTSLKVQRVNFVETELSAFYNVDILATGIDTAQADGFVNKPEKFVLPTDVYVTGDGENSIIVSDRGSDSIYQFSSTGFEGVEPPAATGLEKFQSVSFGGTGSAVTQFKNPAAVAHFKDILYVADAGNGRVLRFKLTIDFD